MAADDPFASDADMTGIFEDPTFSNIVLDSSTPAFQTAYRQSTYHESSISNILEELASADHANSLFESDIKQDPFSDRRDSNNVTSNTSGHSTQSSVHESVPGSVTQTLAGNETSSESPPATMPAPQKQSLGQNRDGEMSLLLENDGLFMPAWHNANMMTIPDPQHHPAWQPDQPAMSPGLLQSDRNDYQSHTQHDFAPVPAHNGNSANNTDFMFRPCIQSGQRSMSYPSQFDQQPNMELNHSSFHAQTFDPNLVTAASHPAPTWSADMGRTMSSSEAIALTRLPSQAGQPITPTGKTKLAGRIPMHIAPIAAKSRVETQIIIRMTLDRLPHGIRYVHLPTHTIAKTKLLVPEYQPSPDTLELCCTVVCTSAMQSQRTRQRALRKAALQDSGLIRPLLDSVDDLPEEDQPLKGGEVRICANCINRERKRAARKKLKKEEEQAHWERYESERIVVFNTVEHKEWIAWKPTEVTKGTCVPLGQIDVAAPSATAVQITAPMRIACYCRHQSEKDGFRVIFTLKDYAGNVVSQDMTDSILITDDHKAPPFSATDSPCRESPTDSSVNFANSQSMTDLASHVPKVSTSKSTGNLQALKSSIRAEKLRLSGRGRQLETQSGQTSGSVTPRNLSRPVSPSATTQVGPSKKRKSTASASHKRINSAGASSRNVFIPQKLTTSFSTAALPTPNTGLPPSALTDPTLFPPHTSQYTDMFSPDSMPPGEPQYNAMSRSTSIDQSQIPPFYSIVNNAQLNRVQSRPQSPTSHMFPPNGQASLSSPMGPMRVNSFALPTPASYPSPVPIIDKVLPAEGSVAGGIEVSIYGQNFVPGMQVAFGNAMATTTTYWAEKALVCVLPPGTAGPVAVSICTEQGQRYTKPAGLSPVFKYTADTTDVRMMEMALRFYSLKTTGDAERWLDGAHNAATAWMSSGVANGGLQ